LQIKNKWFIIKVINSKVKYHKSVIILKFELIFKELILIYQNKIILNNVLLIKKAKLLADKLKMFQEIL